MKRLIAFISLLILALGIMCSCGNKMFIDTTYSFDYALVEFPDGTSQKIEIASWTDYADGDQIQIITPDGTAYLFHASKCVLVSEPDSAN
ncbi:MAG: hypothetical protein J6B34_04130 [Clostridia bacterium]|nr:hypothetical protein [Clostridia bacterium]